LRRPKGEKRQLIIFCFMGRRDWEKQP